MLFSIIVPVYNVAEYLPKCIFSLANQTFRNIEILLIDDGSSDSSGIICDDFAQKDERIKVIHKENGGLSDARNVGIMSATGDYVLFVDADDFIDNDLCRQLSAITNMEPDVLVIDGSLFMLEDW